MKKEKTIDDYVYISVMLTILILILGYISYILMGKPDIFTCAIQKKIGIYCPGCGCTRALISIFEGNILMSLKYNPTVLYSVVTTTVYVITNTVNKIFNTKSPVFIMKYRPIYLYIGIILLVTTCIAKNIL